MLDKKLVETVVERLNPQSTVSAGTVEAVLDTLSEMGLLVPSLTPSDALSDDPAFTISFQDYLSLSAAERRALTLDLQERNRDWLGRQLNARQAAWILVIGGQIMELSPLLDHYPTPERLMKLGADYNRIPFVFTRPPLFEEVLLSPLSNLCLRKVLIIAQKFGLDVKLKMCGQY